MKRIIRDSFTQHCEECGMSGEVRDELRHINNCSLQGETAVNPYSDRTLAEDVPTITNGL